MRAANQSPSALHMRPGVTAGAEELTKRATRRTRRRTPRSASPRRRRVLPRPLGPHKVEHGSVRIPVRRLDGGFVMVKLTPVDYSIGMRHKWRLDRDGYACTNVFDVKLRRSTRLALHRLVARAPGGILVDHVFANKLDCRRAALRHATGSENAANRRASRLGRSSRYRGVTLHRQSGRYQAQCEHAGIYHYLGLYDDQESAARAYNAKARQLWGKFANLNRIRRSRVA